MHLSTENKQEIFKAHGLKKSSADTGSAESQIALFTQRINHINEHLQSNKKDQGSRMGLLKLVGKRKRLLSYLQDKDILRYRAVLADLNLRK